jgi:hypothetical protein
MENKQKYPHRWGHFIKTYPQMGMFLKETRFQDFKIE